MGGGDWLAPLGREGAGKQKAAQSQERGAARPHFPEDPRASLAQGRAWGLVLKARAKGGTGGAQL